LQDPETGADYEIDFSNSRVRTEFQRLAEKERCDRETLFRRKQIDSISLRTDQDYFPVIRSFFLRREKRLNRL
jgi:hypothetical protein